MGLARDAIARGSDMRVCAPALIARKPTDRVKTDQRDAEILARQLAAGGLSFVRVPTPAEEPLRDLVRAREAVRQDLTRAVAHPRLPALDTLTALALCAEIGDFDRFARPSQLSAYLGIVPAEYTTDSKQRLGSITRPDRLTRGRCLLKRPGTAVAFPGSARRSSAASAGSARASFRSLGALTGAFTSATASYATSDTRLPAWPSSPAPARC